MTIRAVRWCGLALADAGVLVGLRPDIGALAGQLLAPHSWFARVGTDRAVAELAGAALWLVALWLAVGLATGAAACLPGVVGRAFARVSRAVLPRVVRRLLAGSAGLGVFLAPALAASAHPTPGPDPAGGQATSSVPAPIWPNSTVGATPSAIPSTRRSATPSPPSPTAHPRTSSSESPRPGESTTVSPEPGGDRPLPRHTSGRVRPTGTTAGPSRVRVRTGDSLWLLAARRLGPDAGAEQVAAYWPRWYAANRAVIGADPALITPDEVLQVPAPPVRQAP